MKLLNPVRLARMINRNLRKADVAFRVAFLRRFNQMELFDRILPKYLQKFSWHISWDLVFLPSPEEMRGISWNQESPYLSRKIQYSSHSSTFPNPFKSDIAIVVQGPIVSENQVTLRVITFYVKKFPDAAIILSTWENTPKEELDPFTKLAEIGKIKIVLSDDIKTPGVFNINRQIVSTVNGLKAAKSEQNYAIKTRTDQVLTNPRLMSYLKLLLENQTSESSNGPRIVISSLNTFAFRLYGASDMFQFGTTKDLLEFWEQPLDTRPDEYLTKISTNLELEAKKRVAEVYLNTNYFSLLEGRNPSYLFEESLSFMAKRFVVADADSLGHKWLKNTNLNDRWQVAQFPNKFYELSHLDWISINVNPKDWFEYQQFVTSEEFYNDK